ncbi:hypothetical protein AOC36_02495 [Erysipelothrix larvae]|uniref:Phosphoenolpyruvate carboxykinase n=1 Tax=Erysipelothrix larvae TaxID=1514105 RepID=A0A0X8GYQ9_9FIRM|nr:hypothetical protein [Erysipelothrix larvae]AMC92891.1 hypothetical protein AOC36_02495 [Erysipelothrix larvae]
MAESLYIKGDTAILNFNDGFPVRNSDILNSDAFKIIIDGYLQQAQPSILEWLSLSKTNGKTIQNELISCLRELLVTPLDSVAHPYIQNRRALLEVIEGIYTYWRNFQRCSIIYINKHQKSELINFMERDGEFNRILLGFYRIFQEKVQGRKNSVYRQLHAGTNASVTLIVKQNKVPSTYSNVKKLVSIDSILLRSPLLLHPKTNKREGHFQEVYENPIEGLEFSSEEFFCYPAKVGSYLAMIYFHKDFIFSGLSLSNLFELASTEEINSRKPDIIVTFGVKDGTDDMVFYNDRKNDIVVGKIAYNPKIEYFGYLKKITLTCHNVAAMNKKRLPIHGAMVNVYLKDKRKYGVVFMGDSGAGKSEIIEEITNMGSDNIERMDVIFDDMGSFGLNNGEVYAKGSEIGAFVRLDDLDRSLPYQAMDRSIFMNPESTVNARVIIPVSDYETISSDHKVDFFFYANNYEDKIGLEIFENAAQHKQVFVEGKRMAKATTHEVGITTSYFANPFGPLQKQDVCDPLIDLYFDAFKGSNVHVGQVFTKLGVEDRDENDLKRSAKEVLDMLVNYRG